ncbi:MAG: DUF4328 domain-containing protein [Gemmatimonadales bacterium]|nr:DUF4328 domain-containing protein [Gemmatimonadales bacterium]MYC87412.1 DUF4328 domain-containing protein [Candidatus Palauibacter denitrificans]
MDDANPAAGDATGPDAGFQDLTALAKWTRIFLYAGIALALVSVWELAGGPQMGGSGEPPEGWTLVAVIRLLAGTAVGLGTAILVLSWIYRANDNARQLGAAEMRFTPGWAVGWYFIPIAWFWKPYQAMTEIWRASVNPSDWRATPVSPLLRWWWGLWIVNSWGLDIVDLVASYRLDEAGTETLEAATTLVGNVVDIPLALVLVAIITAITQLQTAHHRRQTGP